MKSIKIIYWTTTILFAGFMILTSIPDILMSEEAVKFMTHLGYPEYFIPFIGVAKVLGCIAILIPSFKKIKEWAYAGLVFDLIGAIYSNIRVDGFNAGMLVFGIFFSLAYFSYSYNEKLHNATNS